MRLEAKKREIDTTTRVFHVDNNPVQGERDRDRDRDRKQRQRDTQISVFYSIFRLGSNPSNQISKALS